MSVGDKIKSSYIFFLLSLCQPLLSLWFSSPSSWHTKVTMFAWDQLVSLFPKRMLNVCVFVCLWCPFVVYDSTLSSHFLANSIRPERSRRACLLMICVPSEIPYLIVSHLIIYNSLFLSFIHICWTENSMNWIELNCCSVALAASAIIVKMNLNSTFNQLATQCELVWFDAF